MRRFTRYGVFFAALAATTLLTVTVQKHVADPSLSSRPIHDWDIAELAVYLNRLGVEVRLRAVPKNNTLTYSAFLTLTAKEWSDLNALNRDPSRIHEWRGTLYCERASENGKRYLVDQSGDHGLVIGPFFFYGDAELLERVRAALAPLAPPDAP